MGVIEKSLSKPKSLLWHVVIQKEALNALLNTKWAMIMSKDWSSSTSFQPEAQAVFINCLNQDEQDPDLNMAPRRQTSVYHGMQHPSRSSPCWSIIHTAHRCSSAKHILTIISSNTSWLLQKLGPQIQEVWDLAETTHIPLFSMAALGFMLMLALWFLASIAQVFSLPPEWVPSTSSQTITISSLTKGAEYYFVTEPSGKDPVIQGCPGSDSL